MKHFRAYLLGHRCTVLTDHAACVSLPNTPRPSSKLVRWAMVIQEMDLHIKHRSGRSNASADALSRHPVNDAMPHSLTPSPRWDIELYGGGFSMHPDRSIRSWWSSKKRRVNQGPRKEYQRKFRDQNDDCHSSSVDSQSLVDTQSLDTSTSSVLLDDWDEFTL